MTPSLCKKMILYWHLLRLSLSTILTHFPILSTQKSMKNRFAKGFLLHFSESYGYVLFDRCTDFPELVSKLSGFSR